MGKVKNENYITIQGFMVNELELKGNELIIYAIIYGFSQDENQTFTGSLQYLADWTNLSKQSVINCLKSLLEKGIIIKKDKYINNVKFVEYYSKNLNRVVKNFEQGSQKTLIGGSQKTLTNNININNINNNIKNKIEYINIVDEVVNYLNERVGSNYKSNTPKTRDKIKARINEGFVLEDFKKVIDIKFIEWKGTEFEKYLRPETLFGTKFESYLNQKVKKTLNEYAKTINISEVFNK